MNGRRVSEPPKDGSEFMVRIDRWVRAYWDGELETFVLVQPLNIESIARAQEWLPIGVSNAPKKKGRRGRDRQPC